MRSAFCLMGFVVVFSAPNWNNWDYEIGPYPHHITPFNENDHNDPQVELLATFDVPADVCISIVEDRQSANEFLDEKIQAKGEPLGRTQSR